MGLLPGREERLVPFAQIDITSGLSPGYDVAGTSTSTLVNWEADGSGASKPRTALSAHTLASASTDPVVEVAAWGRRLAWITQDSSNIRKLWYQDRGGLTATQVSDSTAATQLGGTSRPVFSFGSGVAYIAGGSYLLKWDPSAATASQVAASPRCTHVAALGQRLLVNDTDNPGNVRWSDIGEGVWSTWPAANATNADARPDDIVGIYENGQEAFVFGETTTQVYGVGTDALFPFEAINAIDGGLGAPYAVARKDGSFFLLDERRAIVRTDGRSREYIDAEFGRALRGFSTISDCFAYYDSSEQRQQIVFCFPTVGAVYARDLTSNRWTERAYYSGSYTRARFPITAATYWPATGQYIYGSSLTAGGLLKNDLDYRADMGGTVPIVCERMTGWHDHGSFEWKRSRGLRIVLRRGTAAQGATPSALEIRVQNDGDAWSDWEQLSVGAPDDYETVLDVRLGGVFRRRRYHLRYAGSDDATLVAAFDDVQTLGGEA